jgi:hypothetical protein
MNASALARWRYAIGTVALATTLSGRGNAEEATVSKAREYFRAGAQAYSIGEYDVAIQAFEQAYDLAPRPAVLFSIAQAERRQYFLSRDPQHLNRAVDMYRKYLQDEAQPARKTDAVQALSELEPLLVAAASNKQSAGGSNAAREASKPASLNALPPTRVMITSPIEGARIAFDDQPASPSPFVREVEPGQHSVRVAASGYESSERKVIAVNGELVTMDVALTELPAKLEIVAPRDSQLTVDGRVQGRLPFPRPIELAAGPHVIAVSKSGFVGISEEVQLQRGQSTLFRASLRRSPQRTAAMFMLGASASALTTGVIFAYFSYKQEQAARSFLDSRGTRPLTTDDRDFYNNTRLDRDRLRGAAWLSLGVGLGLGATSAFIWLNDGGSIKAVEHEHQAPKGAKQPLLQLRGQPVIAPGFAGFGLRGAF